MYYKTSINKIFYLLFCTNSLTSSVHVTLTVHLNLDQSHFNCSRAFCIGPCRCGALPPALTAHLSWKWVSYSPSSEHSFPGVASLYPLDHPLGPRTGCSTWEKECLKSTYEILSDMCLWVACFPALHVCVYVRSRLS